MNLRLISYIDLDEKFWYDFDYLVTMEVEHIVQLNSNWLRAYIDNYLKKSQLKILCVYADNKLVGCLPMQLEKSRATRFWSYHILEILGNGPTDFFDIPLRKGLEKDILLLMIKYLKKKYFWDRIVLKNISETSKVITPLIQALNEHGLAFDLSRPNGFYWVDTNSQNWETYEREEFLKNNSDLNKAERRLKNDGIELYIEIFYTDIYLRLIDNINLYATRRDSLGQVNTYMTAERKGFLEQLITLYEKKNEVELTLLMDSSQTVWAFQLDWVFNSIRYHWNHAYNEDFKRYSPGKVLLKELMIRSFNDLNIKSCNHMRGLSDYKSKLVNRNNMFIQIEINNPKSFRLKATKLVSKGFKILRH
ncbi:MULTISPECIES: GNAT family N-acetyltransferase [Bizionia]|uniref:GNAT family N-acetyltransferase n=1 Tax=Bizionia algoritergicola TaxID=291187 RepID=A0A5D0QRV8_9FLAO|nr:MULTISPECIES: GNAT family N-acetyltransferase [Bizionia]OBX23253.1 hypothetical protein BAA08_05520 [Bizionia sp. APA-3]TYB71625.1 GNAT family N-acetyltransferase [Bizionia algoritergicola]